MCGCGSRGHVHGSRQPSDGHPTGKVQAREKNKKMAQGGGEGQRMKALRAMKEALTGRVAGSPEMVLTAAMVRELEENRREMCGQDRRGVAAAVLMAAEEHGM